jgi:hypothetical protein
MAAETTPHPEPRWNPPYPYNFPAAIESMGSIAAPLLAGFSITLAVLILSSTAHFRWVNASTFLLVAAALALIASVQFAFQARQYVVTPSQIEEWWPFPDDPPTREYLRRVQRDHRKRSRRWGDFARYAYDIGLLCLLLGVTSILAPARGLTHASDGRLATVALALLAFTIEACWIVRSLIPIRTSELPVVGPEDDLC